MHRHGDLHGFGASRFVYFDSREPVMLRQFALGALLICVCICSWLTSFAQAQPAASKRQDPPAATHQTRALRELRQVFSDRYRVATTRSEKAALAEYLLVQSPKLSQAPDQFYAALDEARRVAIDAGDLKMANEAINALESNFRVDGLRLRGAAYMELAQHIRADERAAFVESVLQVAQQGQQQGRLRGASQLADLAWQHAASLRDKGVRRRVRERMSAIQTQQAAAEQLEEAKSRLAKDPSDSEANFFVGKSECEAGDWKSGLVRLAISSHQELKRCAKADVAFAAGPKAGTDWAGAVRLADHWRSTAEDKRIERVCLQRAQFWYRRALPSASPLGRVKIEDNLAAIHQTLLNSADETPASTANAASVPPSIARVPKSGRTPRVNAAYHRDPKAGRFLPQRMQPVGTLEGHRQTVWSLAFHADKPWLASAGGDGQILIWDLNQRAAKPIKSLDGHGDAVFDVAFGPSEWLLSAAKDKTVRLWSIASETSQIIAKHEAEVRDVAVGSAGILATASADRSIFLAQMRGNRAEPTVEPLQLLKGHKNIVHAAEWIDERRIVSGSLDGTLRFWAIGGAPQVMELGAGVNCLAVSANGKQIAVGLDNSQVLLLDVNKPDRRPLLGHQGAVFDVAFSPDGATLVSAGKDKTIRFWDVSKAISAAPPLAVHRDEVKALAFSPDGKWFASSGKDRLVRIWRVD